MKKAKKVIALGIVTISVMASTAAPSFAGSWRQNNVGWWYATNDAGTTWHSNSWQWLDGNKDGIAECYYFDGNGYCLVNTVTPDGYQVDANGAWTANGVVQTKAVAIVASGIIKNSSKSTTKKSTKTSTTVSTSKSQSNDTSLSESSATYEDVQVYTGDVLAKSEDEDVEKDYSNYARECFDLINEKRKANGVDELEWNDSIAEACDVRAHELAEKFSHLRPDGTLGIAIYDDIGLDCEAEGENIVSGRNTPKGAVAAWMNSAGHKKVLLNKKFTDSAIGFYYDEDKNQCYWVQLFARPKD